MRRLHEEAFDPRRLVDETIYATEERLSDYRIDDPDIVPLLYQAGYLTIKAHDERTEEYVLAVPNAEVEFGCWGSSCRRARGYVAPFKAHSIYDLVRNVHREDRLSPARLAGRS